MYSQIDSNKRKSVVLVFIFIATITFLGWFIGVYLNYGYEILIIAVVFSLLISLVSYYGSAGLALSSAGAKPVLEKNNNPYVWRMVENLSITAGIQMPAIYIIEDSALNAFATGRDPKHASIALTTGIIETLNNEELEGVIAHELSHIKNYDIRYLTMVVVLVGVISLIAHWFLRAGMFGGGRKRGNNGGGILMVVGILFLVVSPIIAELLKLAVSRKREFLADASGALLTRYPEGLASALEKISEHPQKLKRANRATAHLFINNPFKTKKSVKLFSTHPPIEERIKALRYKM
jgi:heat shock protein HtpX